MFTYFLCFRPCFKCFTNFICNTLWHRGSYLPHFTGAEAEAQRRRPSNPVWMASSFENPLRWWALGFKCRCTSASSHAGVDVSVNSSELGQSAWAHGSRVKGRERMWFLREGNAAGEPSRNASFHPGTVCWRHCKHRNGANTENEALSNPKRKCRACSLSSSLLLICYLSFSMFSPTMWQSPGLVSLPNLLCKSSLVLWPLHIGWLRALFLLKTNFIYNKWLLKK